MNARDQIFAMLADEDVDFVGDVACPDVPVLTYRWSRSDEVASCPPGELIARWRRAMEEIGLNNIRSAGNHLRGDSASGHRVKMTALRSDNRSMFILMTAGMPKTREQAKALNRSISARIESNEPAGGPRGAGRLLRPMTQPQLEPSARI